VSIHVERSVFGEAGGEDSFRAFGKMEASVQRVKNAGAFGGFSRKSQAPRHEENERITQ
jgi:hypothetical protein